LTLGLFPGVFGLKSAIGAVPDIVV
jgi:hypothetical protein